jgi:hypothetical protein
LVGVCEQEANMSFLLLAVLLCCPTLTAVVVCFAACPSKSSFCKKYFLLRQVKYSAGALYGSFGPAPEQ